MKSKINVVIHKEGSSNPVILKAIGRHNGGDLTIDPQTLTGYILGQKIEYPNLYKGISVIPEGDTLHISEDNGESFTLSLTFTEVHELKPEQSQDTNQAASEAPSLLLYDQTNWDDAVQFPDVN